MLEIIVVGEDSEIAPNHHKGGVIYHYTNEDGEKQANHYQTYIDCVGQPHLNYSQFPFKSMLSDKMVSQARLRFKSEEMGRLGFENGNEKIEQGEDGTYYLQVSGIAINDNFQVLDHYGAYNERIYMMAVPYMGGLNPDYSGLDFCEEASKRIVSSMLNTEKYLPMVK